MIGATLSGLKFVNQLLTAGIAITAFSLLLYALTFNLRDRVARTFALILICVVIVFVGDAISSIVSSNQMLQLWLQSEWLGITLLPACYFHFSDALMATTGSQSYGSQKWFVRLLYLISLGFLATLPFMLLVGPLVPDASPAPHLERTWFTWLFALYFAAAMVWSWINFRRAYQRTVTPTSRRRMRYLITGALAPVLGSYPFLLFGSSLATNHPLLFWLVAVLNNLLVLVLLVIMAYSVAFFGVSWPDRVVKRRLFKWLMRGPVTASTVLAITTLVRRAGEYFGFEYTAAVPIVMVGTLLLFEYAITLAAPLWERWSFSGGDKSNLLLVQTLNERLLTTGDMRQFLESVLAAVCDRIQASRAFIIALDAGDLEMMVSIGDTPAIDEMSDGINHIVAQNGNGKGFFTWNSYWLIPLHSQRINEGALLGILGIARKPESVLGEDQKEAVLFLAERAATALEDHVQQQEIFNSIETLSPQIDMIQRLRAASRYDGTNVLTAPDIPLESPDLARWVKDALTHYWGGPRLTDSPLMGLKVVQKTLEEHQDNPANALRAILRQAVEQVRPEGERRFTGEWILYNILEMKFMEGKKVREIAARLSMSEADLYRKQRVAVEAVADAILEMEQKARADTKSG
ncbi:MAG: histidine kinase N-terminal 7TM domain-containing protein [Anaerolineales bacterium]|jgi:hypothetical protein